MNDFTKYFLKKGNEINFIKVKGALIVHIWVFLIIFNSSYLLSLNSNTFGPLKEEIFKCNLSPIMAFAIILIIMLPLTMSAQDKIEDFFSTKKANINFTRNFRLMIKNRSIPPLIKILLSVGNKVFSFTAKLFCKFSYLVLGFIILDLVLKNTRYFNRDWYYVSTIFYGIVMGTLYIATAEKYRRYKMFLVTLVYISFISGSFSVLKDWQNKETTYFDKEPNIFMRKFGNITLLHKNDTVNLVSDVTGKSVFSFDMDIKIPQKSKKQKERNKL